jgi:DmsE family decaheme c-type cytochrome
MAGYPRASTATLTATLTLLWLLGSLSGASARAGAASGGAAPAAARPAPAVSPYTDQGADTCLGCHSDNPNVLAIFRTAHARPGDPRGPFGHGGLQCEACHGPGRAHARGGSLLRIIVFGPKSHTGVAQQNHMCLTCHQTDAAHDWPASAHAANDVSCADCHRLHQAEDPVRATATQVDVCGKCHQAEANALFKPSRHPLRERTMTCTSCHSPHGSTAPASLIANTVNETCTTCHAQYRGPFLWEHQPVTENCDNCHEPHGSVQPTLLKARAPFLCQQCHQAAGHPSAPNTPRGLPSGMPSPFLLVGACLNCHAQIHGSNDPSGSTLMR